MFTLLPSVQAASFVLSLLKLTPRSFLEALELVAGKNGYLLAVTRDRIARLHKGSARCLNGAQETASRRQRGPIRPNGLRQELYALLHLLPH